MKRILTILIACFLTMVVFAQVPERMSYQAVIRDASNSLLVSANVGMKISVLQGSSSGAEVYVESHTATTNVNGLVTLSIGNGDPVLGSFSTIDWPNGPFFLKTETDIEGGSNYTITTVNELLSVPFAEFAKSAGSCSETDPVFEDYQPNFWQFSGLNSGYIEVGTEWTNLFPTDPFTFVKSLDKTDIEITVLSNFSGGIFDGASGIQFKVLVDGLQYSYGNLGSIRADNTIDFLTLYSINRYLMAGNHTVSIWSKTNSGISTNVLADPGGWGGTIILKEVR